MDVVQLSKRGSRGVSLQEPNLNNYVEEIPVYSRTGSRRCAHYRAECNSLVRVRQMVS